MGDVTERYKKLDGREHVLLRPSVYIGSTLNETIDTYVYDEDLHTVVFKTVCYNPGLYKIFDEILVNAIDHCHRIIKPNQHATKNIKVTIDRATGVIEVYNDGDGIEVVHHSDSMYLPELLFGSLLTSSNYDDETNTDRTIGGQNGIGAKVCNIMSSVFTVETLDVETQQLFKMTWYDNMSRKSPPAVTHSTNKTPYTKITFCPDYQRFYAPDGLSEDMYAVLMKRACDAAAVTPDTVTVTLNGTRLPAKTLLKYVNLYEDFKDVEKFECKPHERLEIVVVPSAAFRQVSFVNGILTRKGGRHVDAVMKEVSKELMSALKKKFKTANIKPSAIRESMTIFVKAVIGSPVFDSQSKDCLETPITEQDSKFSVKLTAAFINKLCKCTSPIWASAVQALEVQQSQDAKKTDGKKRANVRGIEKLYDATYAGTPKSKQCTLILTEGDSAKTMAVTGVAAIGSDFYGVFPLKGKVLNVNGVSADKIANNEEIGNLKKILGLESNKDYTESIDTLRYGRVMLMSDQDYDGFHIRGLVMNLFKELWPSLLRRDGFLVTLLTPIIKCVRTAGPESRWFYNLSDYEAFARSLPSMAGWKVKYYKGLGTSTPEEAKQYFRDMRIVQYVHTGESSDQRLSMAFSKSLADRRKEWLAAYDRTKTLTFVDSGVTDVSYEDYVDMELIHFSIYDNERSIPSVIDGLKVSQRKVLFTCFNMNLREEIRVAQLASYTVAHTNYHHGEASLHGTITGMAQDFTGSNNINLMRPIGQFGTRLQGGKDASSPRYIHTFPSAIARKLFRKEDDPVLCYLEDDGKSIEPVYYVPVAPFVLMNGAEGIGTGYNTSVPPHSPLEVTALVRERIRGGGLQDAVLVPWYRGFKGQVSDGNTSGIHERTGADTIKITELPVGTWTEAYKTKYLDGNLAPAGPLKTYEHRLSEVHVDFTLHFQPGYLPAPEQQDAHDLVKKFGLVSRLDRNMNLFDGNGGIKKYATAGAVLEDFMAVRRELYEKRMLHETQRLQMDLVMKRDRLRFIREVIAKDLLLMERRRADVESDLHDRGYSCHNGTYAYLLNMPASTFTAEKLEELQDEARTAEQRLDEYTSITLEELWMAELDEFDEAYRQMSNEDQLRWSDGALGDSVPGKKASAPRSASKPKPRARTGHGESGPSGPKKRARKGGKQPVLAA